MARGEGDKVSFPHVAITILFISLLPANNKHNVMTSDGSFIHAGNHLLQSSSDYMHVWTNLRCSHSNTGFVPQVWELLIGTICPIIVEKKWNHRTKKCLWNLIFYNDCVTIGHNVFLELCQTAVKFRQAWWKWISESITVFLFSLWGEVLKGACHILL